MSAPALLGGTPVLSEPPPPFRGIGGREAAAVAAVVAAGELSGFYGSWGERFLGGPRVREFEERLCRLFAVRHAVTMNSATSGLIAAMGAIGISPGDEVIVPPYTMSATATAPLVYGGVPVFVDVEDETFGLDPAAVERAVSPRTRAILAVNLFGHPARLSELRAIADRHGIFLVEDNAQGPLASDNGRFAGTIGHIGVFSLNYHKHVHCGEGGFCLTDDDEAATRLRLIRNHAESCAEESGVADASRLIGFNFRLTELSAAVAIAQYERAEELVGRCERIGRRLTEATRGLVGLYPPEVRRGCRHVHYVWALRVVSEELGVSRGMFSAALAAEGFPHFRGYVAPLYRLPLFRGRVLPDRPGLPPANGPCPTTERLHERELLGFEPCAHAVDDHTLDALADALRKVHAHRDALRAAESNRPFS